MDARWVLFVEQYPQVMAAYRKVAKMAWFQEEGWVGFAVASNQKSCGHFASAALLIYIFIPTDA